MNSPVARNALILIAVIASGAALYWLADILTPLAMALFLMVMIDGFTRVLKSRAPWLPKAAAMPVAIAVFVVACGLVVWLVADNTRPFIERLITAKPRLDGMLTRLAELFGGQVPPTVDQLFRRLDTGKYIGVLAQSLQNIASQAVFVFIYLGFLLASRTGFDQKAHRLFDESHEHAHAAQVFVRIRDGIERYLWIQTVTGLIIAVAAWAMMAALGVESAVFWAFLIFVFQYIPVIGGAVGMILPAVFALVQFDTYWQAAVLATAMYVVQFIVGNIVQPKMQGDSLNVDPVVVLLALALWGALWGVTGMFLSTPLTVMAMVILVQFRSTRWIAILLSGNGRPERLSDGPSDPSQPTHKRRKTPLPPEELEPNPAP